MQSVRIHFRQASRRLDVLFSCAYALFKCASVACGPTEPVILDSSLEYELHTVFDEHCSCYELLWSDQDAHLS